MLDKIKPAIAEVKTEPGEARNASNLPFVNAVAVQNVHLTIEAIKNQSPVLAEMQENGEIDIVGGMYDVGTGLVEILA